MSFLLFLIGLCTDQACVIEANIRSIVAGQTGGPKATRRDSLEGRVVSCAEEEAHAKCL